MSRRFRFLLVLALLIAATVVASLRPGQSGVSLASVRQIWSGTLRDIDQPGLRLTRLSASEEMQLGADLLRTMPWSEDPSATPRLVRVSQPMLPHVQIGRAHV